jgi:ABC-type multidrug transport system fused ATPase/permease subunit
LSSLTTDPAQLPTTASGYFRRYRRAYVLGGLFLAAFQLVLNRVDWLSKSTVDRVFADGMGSPLLPGLLMIGLALVAFVLRLLSRWYLFNAGRDAEYELRAQLLHKLHRLGTSFYRRFSPGEIMSRATADLGQVRLLFGFGVLNVLNVIFAFASALQVMVHISGRLTLAAFSTLPLLVLSARFFSRRMFGAAREGQAELGKLGDLAQRHFSGIRIVRSFAIEAFAESRFGQAARRTLDASLALARIRGGMFPLIGGINAMSLLIVVWYGASLLRADPAAGGIGEGDLFAFLLAWGRMAWPMTSAGLTIAVMQRGRACFQRIQEILDAEPDVVEPSAPAPPPLARTGLKVDHLSYALGDRPILRDVSFEVPAGRSLAIVGRTGSGKSTLANLLVRLLPTPRGAVFLDGRDVCELERASLRARIGYAQQDPFLFSTSVTDNVAIGLDVPAGAAPPEAEIAAALRDAQIADEVAALPDGPSTLVGERGVQLSGGQRQRVALARALISRTPLLVLDDPLSAVDARTETAILEALRRRGEVRSIILITHRIAAAARCDQVLVLDEGRVTQAGTHAELLARPGLYAHLAEEQRVEGELEALAEPPPEVASVPTTAAATPTARASAEDDLPSGTDLRLLARLWPFLRSQRAAILAALAMLGALVAVGLLRPLAMGWLMGAAVRGAPLLLPGLCLLAILLGSSGFLFAQLYLTQVAGVRAMLGMRMHLFRFVDGLGMRTFDRTPIGRLVTRVVNDVDAIGEMFASGVFNALGDLVAVAAIIVMMVALDWQLALIAFVSIPAVALIVLYLRRGARQAYRDTRTTTAQLNASLNEQVTGVGVVQAFGRETAMAARFDEINQRYRAANKRAILAESALDAAIEMVQTICIASVILWAGHARAGGALISFAVVITFTQYLRQMFEPVSMLAQRYTVLQSALASAERVFQLLDSNDTSELERDGEGAGATPPGTTEAEQAFALREVEFAYRPGRPVLREVSLAARRGERIALVGPTGAGKSTITQLLLRLYDVDQGEVEVLGTDVRRWPRRTLRRAFSVVPQEVMLFSGTLLDNIALGDAEPDRARAIRALERLGLAERFLKREGGLDARVDERALNFSVGERQLLSFARALYHDAPILLLDEATASIDSATEAQIQTALEELMVGRTTLVIAHRLSTIERADRIVVFQAGRVVESGRHEELLAQGGLYARLHALQVRKAQVQGAA